ncbi:energy-coupling factor transporter transmembrane component T family protein [Candidatus Magnetominusculus dajiuhuensis]|uniref:energy-coupling factor transporter transmembrane component T family protein n=1 Tax=Candidatus Magnetominusculus dajiuhuensis TaxID=3137712 RepID=UPI003B4368A2
MPRRRPIENSLATMSFSPEFKIAVYVIFIVATYLTRDVAILLISGVAAACFFFLYPDRAIRRGLLPISIFLIVTFMSGLFFTGGRVIMSLPGVDITHEGLGDAIVKTARVFLMIVGAKILMLTTSADDMIAGLNRMLPSSGAAEKSSVRDFVEIAGMAMKAFPAIALRLKSDFRERAAVSGLQGLPNLVDKARLSASLIIPLLGDIINSPEKVFVELTENTNEKESHVRRIN